MSTANFEQHINLECINSLSDVNKHVLNSRLIFQSMEGVYFVALNAHIFEEN